MRPFLLIVTFLPFLALAQKPPTEKQLHVKIQMRDGVKLCSNVFRPAGTAKLPTILIRTPYNKGADITANFQAFVDRGYAVVAQDVRGRYDSGGKFDPLHQETLDGSDTLDWIAKQPWSSGKVGMIGGSYLGIAQWRLASMDNPHLKAIFPVVSGDDDYTDRFYSTGGAMKLGHRLLWLSENYHPYGEPEPDFKTYTRHLPLRTADKGATGKTLDLYQTALAHPLYDSYWKDLSTREHIDRIKVPVFSAGGWYDNYAQSDLDAFSALTRLGRMIHTLIGPWPHDMSDRSSGVDYGQASRVPLRRLQLAWFDYWLKGPDSNPDGAPLVNGAPLRIFVMGRNEWRDEYEWPLRRTWWKSLYLDAKTRANTSAGDGVLADKPRRKANPDTFVYDPKDPVPTTGGAVCCNPKIFPWGALDQRPVERRNDVLVYTTPPLKKELEVTGPIKVKLFVSTSAPDTDFTAKLIDLLPDGTARLLTDGILRVRYRNGLESLAPPVRPAEVLMLTIDAGVTSNVFQTGHSIRVEISSSNFPRFDRNLNTGRPLADETEARPARQTVYRDRRYPSHIVLPVIATVR